MPEPLTFSIKRPVRFADSDLLQIVWHGHYVLWLEDARQALGEHIGLSYEALIEYKIAAPIVELGLKYKLSARYGDMLCISAKLHWEETPKLRHTYEVRRESDYVLLTTAETTQVLVNTDGQMLLNFPDFLLDLRKRWQAGEIPATPETVNSPWG
ncbi:MAG: thioesterase family protein [Planctomycetota bacterium]